MICWVGSKISKNIQPTTLAALPWPGGALDKEMIFLVKQGYLLGKFYVLLTMCAGL